MQISNHYAVHLKHITLPINYISVKILKVQVRRIKIYWFFFWKKHLFIIKKNTDKKW